MTVAARATVLAGSWSLELAESAAGVPAREWNALAERGFQRHEWFVAAERLGARARHILLWDAGRRLHAVAPGFVEHEVLHGDLHDRWFGPLRGAVARTPFRLRPTLALRLPFSGFTDPLGDWSDIPEPVLHEVLALFENIARRERLAAVVMPFAVQRADALRLCATSRGYRDAFAGSTAVLDVGWTSLDDYVASRSKSVRKTIRRELEALDRFGIECEVSDSLEEAGRLESLYQDDYRARYGRRASLPDGFMAALAEMRGDGVHWQVARERGDVVSASVMLCGTQTLDGGFAVYGRSRSRAAVYANDLIYQPLRSACARAMTRIDLGPAALYAKVLRGARVEPRVACVKPLSVGTTISVRALAPLVHRWTRVKEARALGSLAQRGEKV